ncbi:class I adenylate-forming enzyme family protein (plasmid) [Rhodococcus opacus]|uniref:class I adenylate-forming enzyme family protein n=1 Tax=Rhodococcus opacus TaxID=37919 RepID=UPI0034D1CA05
MIVKGFTLNLARVVTAHAGQRPDHVAIVHGDREVTYAQLDVMGAKVAAWLLEHGVVRGDRILYYSENSIELLATYMGAARIGAVFAPVNATFKLREMTYVAENAQAAIAFVSADLLPEYQQFSLAAPELPKTIVVVGGEERSYTAHSFTTILDETAEAEIVDVDDAWPVLISYTSGSTSNPKPVLRSHGSEIWSAQTYTDVWDYQPGDRALIGLPLAWVYGLSTTTTALLTAGATIVLLSHFNPVRVLETIETSAVTLFAGTSTMFVKMLNVFRKQPTDLRSIRNFYIGGEPINRAVAEEFEHITGKRIWEGYAATESFPILATMPRHDTDAPRNTCGRLVPGAQIRLVDEWGVPVADGAIGEAQFTCPGRMLAYFREPELTETRLTSDGWVRSGDLLRRDDDGFYFVVGRLSEMIIRGGSNIAPSEVESAIVSLDGVLDATVVSVPDEEYGESLVAFVATDGGTIDESTLRTHLKIQLAAFKIPSTFYFDYELPSGKTGKKDRRAVSDIAKQLASATASEPVA